MAAAATDTCCFTANGEAVAVNYNKCHLPNLCHVYRSSNVSLPSLLPPAASGVDVVWETLRREAELDAGEEPVLRSFYHASVLSHSSLERALASYLAAKLGGGGDNPLSAVVLEKLFMEVLEKDPDIGRSIRADLRASRDRDPACSRTVHCFLYYKGFLAVQVHRIAHSLWMGGRRVPALFLQSKVSEVFAVDVHPAAAIGSGILLDHATGVVIGETAVVGDDVSILHSVTLGGRGKAAADRHPKIGNGVLVGAGTQILGNVRIGDRAKVGAGSVVLKEVPAGTTVVGNPARDVAGKERNG